jgi:hypothetical protein
MRENAHDESLASLIPVKAKGRRATHHEPTPDVNSVANRTSIAS